MKQTRTFDNGRARACAVWICLGSLFAIAAVAAALLVANAPSRAQTGNLLLIYVGAEDCAPCLAWQRGDGAAFRNSSYFDRLTYLEVKAAHLHDVLKDENWPEPVRFYRAHLKRSDGVPLWLVVANNEVVEQRFGAAAWRSDILPVIRSLLR